jgi:predicted nucleic acid-binding protein
LNDGVKRRLYIETTVVSYYTAKPSRDLTIASRQASTRGLWPRLAADFETYISALVLEEAGRGDAGQAQARLAAIGSFEMLAVDEEARKLAEELLRQGAIPKEYPEDALHIAIAAVNGMTALATWNFAHLNNPFTRQMVREAVENAGYRCPEICSPDELLETNA